MTTSHHPDPDRVLAGWPTDGPYSYEGTLSAARAATELVRYLNHATRSPDGLPEPADVYDLIGQLRVLLDRLPQLLIQTGRRAAALAAAPGAALTTPGRPDDTTDPQVAAGTVSSGLAAAAQTLAEISARLGPAHIQAGRLYHREGGAP